MQSWNDISLNTNIAIDDFHNLKDEEGFFHFYNFSLSRIGNGVPSK